MMWHHDVAALSQGQTLTELESYICIWPPDTVIFHALKFKMNLLQRLQLHVF